MSFLFLLYRDESWEDVQKVELSELLSFKELTV